MKKITLFILLVLCTGLIMGCSRQVNRQQNQNQASTVTSQQPAAQGDQMTGSISDVDSTDSNVNVDEVDNELGQIDNTLKNW